jgi:homoserine O-acetyltransferase
MRKFTKWSPIFLTLFLMPLSSFGYDGIVKRNEFRLPAYTTVSGKVIHDVRIGWESYGKLNAKKDNVILLTHPFGGFGHLAGKNSEKDQNPGKWDDIIGSGRAIDTDKFYVICSDTLANLNTKNPLVFTTGPASINPDTAKPYGMSFPVVTILDFVNVQRELLRKLGIEKLYAVMGASMGGMQAIQWGAAYPGFVGRVIVVTSPGEVDAWNIGWLSAWSAPILVDPNWNHGDYYGKAEPIAGLAAALKINSLHVQDPETLNENFGRRWAKDGVNPISAYENKFAIEADLDQKAMSDAKRRDANHFLYLVKAMQTFSIGQGSLEDGLKKLKAPILLLPSSTDRLFYPEKIKAMRNWIFEHKGQVEYLELKGKSGHLNGANGSDIKQASQVIKTFLSK